MSDSSLNAQSARAAVEQLRIHGGLVSKTQLAAEWGTREPHVRHILTREGVPVPRVRASRSDLYLLAEANAWRIADLQRAGKRGPKPAGGSDIALPRRLDADAARQALALVERHGGLATIAELAARRGISRQAVHAQARRPDFPPPRLNAGVDLYLTAEVDEWLAAHAERPGRRGPKPR